MWNQGIRAVIQKDEVHVDLGFLMTDVKVELPRQLNVDAHGAIFPTHDICRFFTT